MIWAAELFGLPSPNLFEHMKSNGMKSKGGVNFGVGGAGVTYAYGHVPLDKQVDHLEGLVKGGILTKKHLNKSVALVCIGVNDYSSFNFFQNTLEVSIKY